MEINIINYNKTEKEIADSMAVYQGKRVSVNGMLKAVKQGHLSVLECAYIEFELKDIPIFVRDHLVRHRHFNFQCQTLRKKVKDLKTYIPDKLDITDLELIAMVNVSFGRTKVLYEKLLKAGVPAEQARSVLPLGTLTKCNMSGNLRSWLEFLQKRYCKHAQKETRVLARMIYNELESLYPNIVKLIDDKCFNPLGKNCERCIREKGE